MTQDINTLRRKFGITAPVAVLIVALACGGDSPSAPTPPNPRPNPGPNPGSNVLHAPDPPPSSPMDPIVHRYALDLSIGSGAGCESVAEDARHRTYVADIHSTGGANYVVRLYEAAFLSGLTCFDRRLPQSGTPTCHQFLASQSEDSLFFDILGPEVDDFNGNLIYEQLPDGKWIEIHGSATGRLHNGTIAAKGSGTLSYWQGFPGLGSTYSLCRSDDFGLTFTPR
jgi:hypothetical protein